MHRRYPPARPATTHLPADMDSLSQLALGAAVGIATMGRRTPAWKAALVGAVAGTLPDLDAFIDYGDPVENMTRHRADSHALFWQTLAAPALGWLAARAVGEAAQWRRWWLAVWLALVTHPLLDLMTVYGTQLLRPFDGEPYGVGSIFIIDPLYTLPLLVGVGVALARRAHAGLAWNVAGLVLSTAYLGWGVAVQQHVRGIALAALAEQGIAHQRLLVTPTALNTVLWRVVAVGDGRYHEGFHSLLDRTHAMRFDAHDAGVPLRTALAGQPAVERIAWFSRGFHALQERDGRVEIADLRMGQAPHFVFTFAVAERRGDVLARLTRPESVGGRGDIGAGLRWTWQRLQGIDSPQDPLAVPPGVPGR